MDSERPAYYLHVGLPKTGTTFLQSLLREHRAALAADGVLYPRFGRSGAMLAALDGRDKHTYRGRTFDASGHWAAFVEKTHGFDGTVVFSHELFGYPHAQGTSTALSQLDGHDTHIVITARDPGRQLPSCWQQHLRHGGTDTFAEYIASVDAADSGRGRFSGQRLDEMLRRWVAHVPAERIHVVAVPPPGAEPDALWDRFCRLLGKDASRYPVTERANPNTSLGVAQAEQLRRVNLVAAERLNATERRRLVRKLYALQILPRTNSRERLALPAYARGIAERLADTWIDAIETLGVNVVGDLRDLRPGSVPGTDPDEWDASEVLAVGAEAAVELLISHASKGNDRHEQ